MKIIQRRQPLVIGVNRQWLQVADSGRCIAQMRVAGAVQRGSRCARRLVPRSLDALSNPERKCPERGAKNHADQVNLDPKSPG